MVQGMSRDAWDKFSKTILVRYVLSYLCGTLYLDPSVSLKRIFAFSVGGLFSLLTHARVNLPEKQVFRANRSTSYNRNKMPAVLTHESTERSWK